MSVAWLFFFFQAEDGIRDLVRSRGLGDVYKRQLHHLRPAQENLAHFAQRDGPVTGRLIGPFAVDTAELGILAVFEAGGSLDPEAAAGVDCGGKRPGGGGWGPEPANGGELEAPAAKQVDHQRGDPQQQRGGRRTRASPG